MKEYCLVPVHIAQKYMHPNVESSLAEVPQRVKKKDNNPSLENLIRLSVSPSLQEYGLSFIRMLEDKPNISWDEQGNLLPPFSGLNILDLINTLGRVKGKSLNVPYSLITLLFRLGNLPFDVIKNLSLKKKLLGDGGGRVGGGGELRWRAY